MPSGACRFCLPRLGVLAGRDHGLGPEFGDGIVALLGVVCPVGGDAGDLLFGRDLTKQLRQNGRIAYVAAGDLDRPDLARLFVDPEMAFVPDAAFCPAMLAGIPLAFPLGLDPRAIDQQVQRALRPPMRDVRGESLLATAECAEVRHLPVQADQAKQALHVPDRLPQGHAEQDLNRQAGLDSSINLERLSSTLSGRPRCPRHLRIEPDRL